MITLPELAAVELEGRPLRVVATTSIIGDVVAQVGGEAIELTTLIGAGQDPHSYEPAIKELTAVAAADVIFVNGWDLEETLIDNLRVIGEGVPMVAISANIEPLPILEDGHEDRKEEPGHQHAVDPHTWLSIKNVEQWVENATQVLTDLDPANGDVYENSAAEYGAELAGLQQYAANELAQVAEERRLLVTNHDSLGYFASEYGFTVIGTVVPAASTLAEPSAGDLAALVALMEARDVCTIITETTGRSSLAQTLAAELEGCDQVEVLQFYTGALGPPGSGADSYTGMFRANVEALVEALRYDRQAS
jgi:ABC-type Zn uptake system ZnuABC Zn-binding protein ZnuA